ncbi:hypothetical protein Tco_0184572 [Tanacetum coccineum]
MCMAKIQEVIPVADEATGPVFEKEPLEQVHNNDEYNMFVMKKEHPKQPVSINDIYVVEQDDSYTTPNSPDMSNNEREVDQDEQKFQQERVLLASLLENDESKKMNKSLRAANTSLTTKLERYKDTKCVKDVEFDCAKAYGLLEEHRINSEKSLDAYELKVQEF